MFCERAYDVCPASLSDHGLRTVCSLLTDPEPALGPHEYVNELIVQIQGRSFNPTTTPEPQLFKGITSFHRLWAARPRGLGESRSSQRNSRKRWLSCLNAADQLYSRLRKLMFNTVPLCFCTEITQLTLYMLTKAFFGEIVSVWFISIVKYA